VKNRGQDHSMESALTPKEQRHAKNKIGNRGTKLLACCVAAAGRIQTYKSTTTTTMPTPKNTKKHQFQVETGHKMSVHSNIITFWRVDPFWTILCTDGLDHKPFRLWRMTDLPYLTSNQCYPHSTRQCSAAQRAHNYLTVTSSIQ
jgi:hypothetical protein